MQVFYSHVNYSVTKIDDGTEEVINSFYSHVNYSVTKIVEISTTASSSFTVT